MRYSRLSSIAPLLFFVVNAALLPDADANCEHYIREISYLKSEIANVRKVLDNYGLYVEPLPKNYSEATMQKGFTDFNKWGKHGGPLLLSDGGITVTAPSNDDRATAIASQAFPFPMDSTGKKHSFSYFEVQIVKLPEIGMYNRNLSYSISIGTCDGEFPLLKKSVGDRENSFGLQLSSTDGKSLDICIANAGKFALTSSQPPLQKDEVIGFGVQNLKEGKQKIFYTYKNQLIEKEVSFHKMLFPAVSLKGSIKIKANFGQEKFKYDLEKLKSKYDH